MSTIRVTDYHRPEDGEDYGPALRRAFAALQPGGTLLDDGGARTLTEPMRLPERATYVGWQRRHPAGGEAAFRRPERRRRLRL